jgi:hypothetical protein
MTPEQMREIGVCLYGSWGWQTKMADVLQVDSSTVRRWLSGKVAIPGPVEVALRLLLQAENNKGSN